MYTTHAHTDTVIWRQFRLFHIGIRTLLSLICISKPMDGSQGRPTCSVHVMTCLLLCKQLAQAPAAGHDAVGPESTKWSSHGSAQASLPSHVMHGKLEKCRLAVLCYCWRWPCLASYSFGFASDRLAAKACTCV